MTAHPRPFTIKYAGILAAFLSAFLFGATPVLAKLSYEGGSNGITLTFIRAAFALPILYFMLKRKRVSLKLTRPQARDLIIIGVFGPSATTLLLYASYESIPIGVATVMHFLFPVVVTVTSVILFKASLNRSLVISVGLGVIGLSFFLTRTDALEWTGLLLALLSSFSYAVYMLGVERSTLKDLHFLKLSFYFCIVSVFVSGIVGSIQGTLTFNMTLEALIYSLLVSILVSVGAISFFQLGILLIGAPTTAILSTLEPVTGILCGMLFLNEHLSWGMAFGSLLIVAGVVIATLAKIRETSKNTTRNN